MEQARTCFDPHTLAKLRGLRLRAQRIVEGYMGGLHRSPYRGFSVEFAEHRQYTAGDDLRHVDWRVLGRTDKVYVKQYEDETNLLCQLVLDVSGSMRFQGPGSPLSKLEYAQCVAASLAWLVLQGRDAVGAVAINSRIVAQAPPAGHPGHLEQILTVLDGTDLHPTRQRVGATLHPLADGAADARTSAEGGGDDAGGLGPALHAVAERSRRRGVVVVLSDLLDDPAELATGLRRFRHRRHDLIALQILDPAELDFPYGGPTLFRGLEGEPALPCDARSLRRAYLDELERHQRTVREACHAQGIDHHVLRTDQPLDVALPRVLADRAARWR